VLLDLERKMGAIKLPQLAWYGRSEEEYQLPNGWQIEICNMNGYDQPAMTPSEIRIALDNPIGSQTLIEMAQGKKEAVIIFDDMSRITHTSDFVPHVLQDLADAGVEDKNIRFVCATGCHGALTRIDFVKKLGENVLERFPVYNHNPFGNCVSIGKTKTFGTDVSINEEVMKCDLKIAIGGVVPHAMTGFGGGGKIILPGISSFESTRFNHHIAQRDWVPSKMGMGNFDENPVRIDIEEAATISGLNFIINVLYNKWGETAQVFCGALKPAYAAAIKESKIHYFTPHVQDKDIVIANAFVKSTEASGCLNIAYTAFGKKGGDILLIANEPAGQITHYLFGSFGCDSCGPEYIPKKLPPNVNRLIIFSKYHDVASRKSFPVSEKVKYLDNWSEVLKVLKLDYPASAGVAVFPYAEMQYTR
jgi:nickel-dependent lactate racemase